MSAQSGSRQWPSRRPGSGSPLPTDVRDPTHGEPETEPSSGHTLAGSPPGNLRVVPPLPGVFASTECGGISE
jgi:hypothetical protein